MKFFNKKLVLRQILNDRLKNQNLLSAFTLTELMVVIVIIGIMASFGVPIYSRAIDRAHQSDASNQLTTIWAAEQVYRAQNGRFWPFDNAAHDITEINTDLTLGIIPTGMTYSCTCTGGSCATPPGNFQCDAIRDPPATAFTVRVTNGVLISGTNPNPCAAGTCP